jgi:hypothetical protein
MVNIIFSPITTLPTIFEYGIRIFGEIAGNNKSIRAKKLLRQIKIGYSFEKEEKNIARKRVKEKNKKNSKENGASQINRISRMLEKQKIIINKSPILSSSSFSRLDDFPKTGSVTPPLTLPFSFPKSKQITTKGFLPSFTYRAKTPPQYLSPPTNLPIFNGLSTLSSDNPLDNFPSPKDVIANGESGSPINGVINSPINGVINSPINDECFSPLNPPRSNLSLSSSSLQNCLSPVLPPSLSPPTDSPKTVVDSNSKEEEDYDKYNSKIVFSVKYPPPQPITKLDIQLPRVKSEDSCDESEKGDDSPRTKNNGGLNKKRLSTPLQIRIRGQSPNSKGFNSNRRQSRSPFSLFLKASIQPSYQNLVDFNIFNAKETDETINQNSNFPSSLLSDSNLYSQETDKYYSMDIQDSELLSMKSSQLSPLFSTPVEGLIKLSPSQSITFSSLCELGCHLLPRHTSTMINFMLSCDFIPCLLTLLIHPIRSLSLSVTRYWS